MTTKLDCIPCLCRQAINAVRAATDDSALQDAILGEALFHLAMRDHEHSPTDLASDLHTLIATRTGKPIPDLLGERPCPHQT